MRRLLVCALLLCGAAPAGCGGSAPPAAPRATAADAAFVRHMLPHHVRAIAVGELAARRGDDPRVRAFGQRIVREQTPEERRLAAWVGTLGLTRAPGDAAGASGFIADPTLRRLRTARGAAFDRAVLEASARSELGAASMAALELRSGTYAPARRLASSIATAPRGEVRELRALAAQL